MTVALAILTLLAALASLAALARVHLLATGCRPLSNAVSDFGVGPHRVWYRAQTAAMAYAALFLAAEVARETHPVPRELVFLLLVLAAARLAIPSFPTDLDRGAPTVTGRIHVLLAGIAFAAVAWAAAIFPDRVATGAHGFFVALGWVVVATAAACGLSMTRALRASAAPYFGAIERVFYAAVYVWFVAASVHFIA